MIARTADALCYRLARWRIQVRTEAGPGGSPAMLDARRYREWRASELRSQLRHGFGGWSFAGKDVLDFGCGAGALAMEVARLGAQSVVGTDLVPTAIAAAQAECIRQELPIQPAFVVARSATRIDLPDQSMDVILCFDTLEHVMEWEAVLGEWRRVLRPAGSVLIWWCPWFHPYGHHIESLVPVPWAHVVFPEAVLTRTCARMYDLPTFTPRTWDLDEHGRKRPNKWRSLTCLPDVNRLTIRQFERGCRRAGWRIYCRRAAGFGGSRAARMTRPLARLPVLKEFFTAHVTYELRAGADAASAVAGRGRVSSAGRSLARVGA